MDITKRLLETDSKLSRHNEGAWDRPYNPYLPGFSSFNDAGVEVETGEFLYAMLRLLKPENVLETGTHWGVGAAYMGTALKDNQKGKLDTLEFLPEIRVRAIERMKTLGLEDVVTCHQGDAAKFTPSHNYQFMLMDTEPQTRFAEVIRYYDYLDAGGFVFIHDLHRSMCQGNINPDWPNMPSWPFGDIPAKISEWVNKDELRPMHFATPRGLTCFYKTHPDDHKWK